jgi:hypothetical protein
MVRHLVARGRLGWDINFQAPSYQGKRANASAWPGGLIFEFNGLRRTAHRGGLNGAPSCSPWSISYGYFFSGRQLSRQARKLLFFVWGCSLRKNSKSKLRALVAYGKFYFCRQFIV